jgi:predicted AAA+ superfamily ATPase
MFFQRKQLENLKRLIAPNKVIVIYGPRRVGKTTLLNAFLEKNKEPFLLLNGEDLETREKINIQSISGLKNLIGDKKLVIIDEAQKIGNIGLNLKLMIDHIEGVKIIATGSSSFDLAKQVGEPLVGRKFTLLMFPLAQMEIGQTENLIETSSNLENRLIYGSYPDIAVSGGDLQKQEKLKEIANSYLYKDILELDGVMHSNKIYRLLQLLAFQIGKEVSLNELGRQLEMNRGTVERYLDLLEKSFVIKSVMGFSRNLRKEVSKNQRYYFYDNGIRNSLIGNLNPVLARDDVGMLWENYIIMERLKKQEYDRIFCNNYFWRTYDKKEIDWVEERGGKLFGYEIKWGNKKTNPPKDWLATYKNAEYKVINKDNYLEFIV